MSSKDLQVEKDILWQHRRELPAFRALIRAIEHRLLVDLGPLPEPLLDIGCGDGHFAEVTIKHAAVGIDIAQPSLVEAKRRGVYDTLSRQTLVDQLENVRRALDDASSVVDAGEGEAYAYQSELQDLRALLEKLQSGAYLIEEQRGRA